MLFISNPDEGGAARYCFKYYTIERLEPGEWCGTGPEILGLKGKMDKAMFCNLMDGRSPEGSCDLVQNAGRENPVPHWDLTFSAPKYAGVLYASGSKRVQKQIIEAHEFAMKVALDFLQSRSRRG